MEREILFRGKQIVSGEWIESLTVFQPDNHMELSEMVELLEGKENE